MTVTKTEAVDGQNYLREQTEWIQLEESVDQTMTGFDADPWITYPSGGSDRAEFNKACKSLGATVHAIYKKYPPSLLAGCVSRNVRRLFVLFPNASFVHPIYNKCQVRVLLHQDDEAQECA